MILPDLIEHVIGFRSWSLGRCSERTGLMEEGLWSINWPTRWSKTMTARCLDKETEHPAPDNDCDCGLYAKHDIMKYPIGLQSGLGYGAVKAWGRLQIHHDGFRAANAEIIALTYGDYWSKEGMARVRRVAESIGVPVVRPDILIALTWEHGGPCPDNLRPEWPRVINPELRP